MNKFLISASGVAIALVMSSTALGAVTSFTSGTTISSGAMNTNFANLNGNLTDGACVGAMTRVGSVCVDNALASIPATLAGCAANGGVGCGSVVAVSGGTAETGASWAQAARACANAGKRLLTPGEWVTARNIGGTIVGFADGSSEWVNAVMSTGTAGLIAVGRIGPDTGPFGGTTSGAGVVGFSSDDTYTDQPGTGFRCAR